MNQFVRVGLAVIGVPIEIVARAFRHRWTLDCDTVYRNLDEDWSLTAIAGMRYDSFTFAPNLRNEDGSYSRAAAIHDQGWNTGRKDSGDILTFDENTHAFSSVLKAEGHPAWIRKVYVKGVQLSILRKRWKKAFNHE